MSQPDEQLAGWLVTGPDGEIVASGSQTTAEAVTAAEEA